MRPAHRRTLAPTKPNSERATVLAFGKLLGDCPLEYPYEGSKSLMFLVSEFEDAEFMKKLLDGIAVEKSQK